MNDNVTTQSQLRISVTMAFENVINTLMTLIDTLVISFIGTDMVAAMGAITVVISLMQISTQTIAVSNNTLVAKSLGQKDFENLKLTTGNSIILCLILCIVTIAVSLIFAPFLPTLFNVLKIASTYFLIRLAGFIQNSLVTILSGHQRSIGNQKNILFLRIFCVFFNLILDIVVTRIGFGIIGIGIVTILIDTILFIYLAIYSKDSIKIQFNKNIFLNILSLFKWNFLERIASKIDNFIFDLIVSRIGTLEYAVHVILIQITNVYEAFTQGFGDGITITVAVANGKNDNKYMENVRNVSKKLIKICTIIFPFIITTVAIIIMQLSFHDENSKLIFISVLPIFVVSATIHMSATYYFSVLRGIRDFKFLAIRNIISSILKITTCAVMALTSLGIVGIWTGYLVYEISQRNLSRNKYIKVCHESSKNNILSKSA